MRMEKLSKQQGRAMQQFKLERLIRLAKAYMDGNTTALMGMEEISRTALQVGEDEVSEVALIEDGDVNQWLVVGSNNTDTIR